MQTKEQIQDLLQHQYNSANWKAFLSKLFISTELFSRPKQLLGIDAAIASQAVHIGNISITENVSTRNIAVYEVALARNVVLERNRVGLRNLLKTHWKDQDAAFIVYYQADSLHLDAKKWRFSYVSELKMFNEAGEYVASNTEPKRYTYVLGEGESCRTAAERFYDLKQKANKATLDDVKEAFSVEKLSKTFFADYKDHYQNFVQFLTGKRLVKVGGKWEEQVIQPPNTQLISVFNNDEKDVRDFCKKLLGRIVFLYFIQKKGWLGVPLTGEWGSGKPDFMSRLLANCANPAIFYSQYLSKLFFETLNQKRDNDLAEIITGEPTKIPYLNGGLFEEDDPKHRDLVFETDLFKKLFAFFDQYNFTIYEDDPNDHTVAVDPEMLGHIFENLLEDNKDKGAFYTPKEIVHYMCQESLIEYLNTWFESKNYQVTQDTFASFENAAQTSFISANDGRTGQGVLEITQSSAKPSKVINRSLIEKLLKKQLSDDDKQAVIQHATAFNEALDKVKICDPAIGSGAFPMGLLLEIFTAKQTIHTFTHGDLTSFAPAMVKLNIIQNSIYGVDIERGAVDIARLRFWLSLVVDETEPKALPNLDYKIVVGNSLIPMLNDDVIDIDWQVKKQETADMFGKAEADKVQQTLTELTQLQTTFFNPNSDKKALAPKIRNLKIELLINQLSLMIETQGVIDSPRKAATQSQKTFVAQTERYLQTMGWQQQINNLNKLKSQANKPLAFFDWQLNFAEVMNKHVAKNGTVGFDIVIGNPPYGANIDNFLSVFKIKFPKTTKGFKDIYKLFYNQGLEKLTKNKGVLAFITPNTFLLQPRYKDLRQFFLKSTILSILNLGENVFDEVTVPTVIIFLKNDSNSGMIHFADISQGSKYTNDINKIKFLEIEQATFQETQNNIFTDNIREKTDGEEPLVKIFDFKDAGINYQRVNVGLSNKGNSDLSDRLLYEGEKEKSAHIEYWKGADINSFYISDTTNRFVRPEIKLRNNERVILNSDYFNIAPKLIWRQTASMPISAVDRKGVWFGRSIQAGIIKPEYTERITYEYLCCLMNSNVLRKLYEQSVQEGGRVFPQVKLEKLKSLPIKIITINEQKPFVELFNKIVKIKTTNANSDIIELEYEMNLRFYKLYKLTFAEAKLIDPDFALTEAEYAAITC